MRPRNAPEIEVVGWSSSIINMLLEIKKKKNHARPSPKLGHGLHLATHSCAEGGGGDNGLLFRFSLSFSQAFSLPPFLPLYKAIEHAPFFPVYFSVTFLKNKFTNVNKYNLEVKQAQNSVKTQTTRCKVLPFFDLRILRFHSVRSPCAKVKQPRHRPTQSSSLTHRLRQNPPPPWGYFSHLWS